MIDTVCPSEVSTMPPTADADAGQNARELRERIKAAGLTIANFAAAAD